MLGREGPAPFRSQAMPSWTFWTIWAIPQGRRGKWRESPWSEWEPGVGVWSRRADLGEDPLTKDPTRIPSWDPKTQSASDWRLWAEMGWWWSWIGTALWVLPQFLKNWNREINWGVQQPPPASTQTEPFISTHPWDWQTGTTLPHLSPSPRAGDVVRKGQLGRERNEAAGWGRWGHCGGTCWCPDQCHDGEEDSRW